MPFALPLPHRILSKALAAAALALPLLMPAGVQAREFELARRQSRLVASGLTPPG